jgi:hypothetical protein
MRRSSAPDVNRILDRFGLLLLDFLQLALEILLGSARQLGIVFLMILAQERRSAHHLEKAVDNAPAHDAHQQTDADDVIQLLQHGCLLVADFPGACGTARNVRGNGRICQII